MKIDPSIKYVIYQVPISHTCITLFHCSPYGDDFLGKEGLFFDCILCRRGLENLLK